MQIEVIKDLYSKASELGYIGEDISQLEHAIQCGDLAVRAQVDSETVLAAFLHDIGHLIPADSQMTNELGRMDHETAGAEYLKNLGFSKRVSELVRLHVLAKRYLVTQHEKYFAKLSEASRKTLELQGGKLTLSEVQAFEKNPLFKEALRIRAWDEEAKVVGQKKERKSQELSFYLELVSHHFEFSQLDRGLV